MAETTYTYSIAGDTLNGAVALVKLQKEIKNSAIVIALKEINSGGDDLDVVFKDALSAGDETILDGIITAHDGIEETIREEKVRVMEESADPAKRTGGAYMGKGLEHIVPAVVGTSETIYTMPFPVAMMAFEYSPTSDMIGDYFTVCIAPRTTVGAITATVNTGDTVLNVSPTVVENVKLGYKIMLDDGGVQENVGYVSAIDTVNNTITVSDAVTNTFLVSSPTYVKITICMVDRVRIGGLGVFELGASKIGGSYLPAGTPWSIEYENNNGLAKSFSGVLELLF